MSRTSFSATGTPSVCSRDPAKAIAAFANAVEVVQGDLTKAETLLSALQGADHVVLTAGVTKRPAPERLVYMSATGTTRGSVLAFLLNLIKGNTLKWRRPSGSGDPRERSRLHHRARWHPERSRGQAAED